MKDVIDVITYDIDPNIVGMTRDSSVEEVHINNAEDEDDSIMLCDGDARIDG